MTKIFSSLKAQGPKEVVDLVNFFQGSVANLPNQIKEELQAEIDAISKEDYEHPWEVLFPEGLLSFDDQTINEIKDRRAVTIKDINPAPLQDLAKEFLISSNVLLDLPLNDDQIDDSNLSKELKNIRKNCTQSYWYDHPIPMDTPLENNEIIYGLKNLDQAIEFEKEKGVFPSGKKLTCLLSLSSTYKELAPLSKQYLQSQLNKIHSFNNLTIIAFSEDDCQNIRESILKPLLKKYDLPECNFSFWGVDGHYGRHYSFLKSITAFLSASTHPELKASFKIDLDQVFDQKALINETGKTAFTHFLSPRWGATAIDSKGRHKKMGMIAGTLVNQSDISKSIFTPDVTIPKNYGEGETEFFCSQIPQAISTAAEMAQNDKPQSRIHVTGGTNGIFIEDLFQYRPFTPSFVGRAEDQAYILSTFDGDSFPLGYLHASGLIMRHDKEGFAVEAIKAAELGKVVGDYERLLIYSSYAKYLCSDLERIKDELYPFTSCFISKYPLTLAFLRLITKVQSFSDSKKQEELAKLAFKRIEKTLHFVKSELQSTIEVEKQGYQIYYDLLSFWKNDTHLKDKAAEIIKHCTLK